MNLGQIELAIYDRMNYNSTPDSAVIRRVRHHINVTQRMILGRKGFGVLRRATLQATSVAGTPYMVLPQATTSVITIIDRTNNRILQPISLQDTRYRDPGQLFSNSIPDAFTVIDYSSCVAMDPTTPSALYVISDSASDGSGVAINIEGTITGGYYRRASVALNGLTAVNLSAAISTWEHIIKFYASASAVGNITLRQGSGVGTELSRIAPGRSYPRYTTVILSGIPAAGQTYYCDVEVQVSDMVNSNDEPLIPEDFHWLLETGVIMRDALKRKDFETYRAEASMFADGMTGLSALIRRRAGVSNAGQRNNQPYRHSSFNNSWMNG